MFNDFNFNLRRIPLIGPLLFRNPNEAHQQEMFHRAAQAYQRYRPELLQARMTALMQTTGMMQPTNNLMAQSWGAQAQMPYQQAYQNPFGVSAMAAGAPAGTDIAVYAGPGSSSGVPPGSTYRIPESILNVRSGEVIVPPQQQIPRGMFDGTKDQK